MKHNLSHQQTEVIQLTGLIVTGIVPWIITFVSIQFLPLLWGIIGSIMINSFGFYFSLKIYKAEFDTSFLYLTRRLNKMKIPLKDVKEVRTFQFPVYVFFGHAYILSLKYYDLKKEKRAYVISRGLFNWKPTVDSISEINLLRQYILYSKYGR